MSASTSEDTPLDVTLIGSDAETCELSFTIVSPPTWGDLGGVGDLACSGDGPFADRASVSYTPDENVYGSDAFTYAVTDDDGASTTATVAIDVASVNDAAPTAGFTSSCTGLDCVFTDASGDPSDAPGGGVVAWSWTFGDGTTSTVQHPSHTYTSDGTYTVRLTVTDTDGATGSTTGSVTVAAPTAETITLSVTGSKTKGIKEATLAWTGASGASVRVFRDGSSLTTTANNGSYTDRIGKGGGTHTYQICEVDTPSNCSGVVSVRF